MTRVVATRFELADFCALKTMKRRLINAGKRGIKMSESIDFADFIELKYVCI